MVRNERHLLWPLLSNGNEVGFCIENINGCQYEKRILTGASSVNGDEVGFCIENVSGRLFAKYDTDGWYGKNVSPQEALREQIQFS